MVSETVLARVKENILGAPQHEDEAGKGPHVSPQQAGGFSEKPAAKNAENAPEPLPFSGVFGKENTAMERIASFSINHLELFPGLYVSRRDRRGDTVVTTFDLRITAPNREPVIDMPALRTIEHLGATYLRNSARKDDIVYFGPMGCRTGCYLLMFGDLSSEDVIGLVTKMCDFILDFEGEIPGAKPEECGNYSEQNLGMAKYYIAKYRKELLENHRFSYPGEN